MAYVLAYHPAVSVRTEKPVNPANRLGLDYADEAARFRRFTFPIIDVHTHIGGLHAAAVYRRAMSLYGAGRVYSMSKLEEVEPLRDEFGDAIRFIAVPDYWGEDRLHNHGKGFIERIGQYAALDSRIAKFWAAPRGIEYGIEVGKPDLLLLDAPHRIEAMHAAAEHGMIFMVHVADPDTWFATKYSDASVFGAKRDHYDRLERVLEMFNRPWIAAHMGGWPENLDFLDGLLSRHANLYLDTSATKWNGRVLFGSDIVTMDEHLHRNESGDTTPQAVALRASSSQEAFDLYCSRYWALRTMFETDYEGESPIADPDLAMVEPERYGEMDAPSLSGKSLPDDVLKTIYHDAAANLLEGAGNAV